MKLLRNESTDGVGKYVLIDTRKAPGLAKGMAQGLAQAGNDGIVSLAVYSSAVNLGTDPKDAFFVLKLADQFTAVALRAYADAVYRHADALADTARAIDAKAVDNRLQHAESALLLRKVLELREYADEVLALVDNFTKSGMPTKIPD